MRTARRLFVVWLGVAVVAYCQGNTFDQIRYQGGTVQTKVDPKDWGNKLTVTSDLIQLDLKDGQSVKIDPKRVQGLSYGQEAHRRVGTMIALGVLLAPLALFGLFHKTRLHFIGIEFTTADGKKSGLLIQGHKDNYRAVLMALRGATGAPVAVSEEDRKYIPTGVAVVTTKGSDEAAPAAAETPKPAETAEVPAPSPQPAERAEPAHPALTAVILKSKPDGAEISVDGKFMGNTPSTIRMEAGDHTVTLTKSGFNEWTRTISVNPGSDITMVAELKEQTVPLRLGEINDLLAGGVPNQRLIQLVQERGVGFHVDDPAVEQLRQSGANDDLINAIRKSSALGKSSL